MTDPATAYFFKKYYRNIIKWWFVVYNLISKKYGLPRKREETARQKELEENVSPMRKSWKKLLPKNRKIR